MKYRMLGGSLAQESKRPSDPVSGLRLAGFANRDELTRMYALIL